LQSPFTSFQQVAADRLALMRLYPASFFPEPSLNNLAIMKKEHAPLLLIHGMKDDMLPYKTGMNLSIPALNKFIHSLN
jgi:hypothetical protein